MPKKSNPRPSVTRAKSDRDVIKAFVDKRPAEGKKLSTDGHRLDGRWMGGSNLASWKGDKIELHDLGSKAADAVQRQIRKTVPKSWLKANPEHDDRESNPAPSETLVPMVKESNPRPKFHVVIYEQEVEWIDEEDPDGYEERTSEEVDDDDATLEDVINYAQRYSIHPRTRNDLTTWWESYPDNEYDFTRNVSRTYSMHVTMNGRPLDDVNFKRINKLINERVWDGRERVANPSTVRHAAIAERLARGG